MSFQESSQSLRSRLHLDATTWSVVIGVVAVVLLVIVLVLLDFCSTSVEVIEQPPEASDRSPAQTRDGAGEDVRATEGAGEADAEGSAEPQVLYVHVGGAVNNPGVYELALETRVGDAVAAAGGFRHDAAQDALNLARPVSDGEQILVPVRGSAGDGSAATSPDGGDAGFDGASSSPGIVAGKVNINVATIAELKTLDGVGDVTAERIVADREENGPFKTIEDLKRVSGIGDKKFEALAPFITVG